MVNYSVLIQNQPSGYDAEYFLKSPELNHHHFKGCPTTTVSLKLGPRNRSAQHQGLPITLYNLLVWPDAGCFSEWMVLGHGQQIGTWLCCSCWYPGYKLASSVMAFPLWIPDMPNETLLWKRWNLLYGSLNLDSFLPRHHLPWTCPLNTVIPMSYCPGWGAQRSPLVHGLQ